MLEDGPNKQQGAMRGSVDIFVNTLSLNLCPSMCVGCCTARGHVFQMRWKMRFLLHVVTDDPMTASIRAGNNPGVLEELWFRSLHFADLNFTCGFN